MTDVSTTRGDSAGVNRAAELTELLASAPDATDHTAVRAFIQQAAALGLALLFIYPGTKKPADMRSPQQRGAERRKAQDDARAAERQDWASVKGPDGLDLATTDVGTLDKYLDRYVGIFSKWSNTDGAEAAWSQKAEVSGAITMTEPVAVSLAVEVGRSGLVVVDCDTTDQTVRFLAAAASYPGGFDTEAPPTVRSPGHAGTNGELDDPATWAHRDGGHWWFDVPEGVTLPPGKGAATLGGRDKSDNADKGDDLGDNADKGYAVLWDRRYVLIPPSVRAEGSYRATGSVRELPEGLLDHITAEAQKWAERRDQARERSREGDDLAQRIDAWAEGVSWASILEPLGWAAVGRPDTSCGCPLWTAPGVHGSPKSATAHNGGCTSGRYTLVNAPLHIWTDRPGAPFADHMVTTGDETVSKLQAVALISYGGDVGEAMTDLGLSGGLEVDMPPEFDRRRCRDGWPPSGSGGPGDTTETAEGDAEAGADADPFVDVPDDVLTRARQLWVDREARKLLTAHDAAEITLPPVVSLDELLAEDDDPVRMRIEQVWPSGGGKGSCAAAAGAGKTTLNGNLIRSLVDGDPFLGAFEVHETVSRIMVIDLEMTPSMMRRWLRRQGVRNTAAVVDVVNLRSTAHLFDMGNDKLRDMWMRRIRDNGIEWVSFDCLKPALDVMGLNENTEMGKFLTPFDAMLGEAGVSDVLVYHHTGHANGSAGERARGDSTLLGWTDVNLKLIWDREKDGNKRYFAADKVRDADEPAPEGLLSWDKATNRLTYAGGDRATTAASANVEKRLNEVLNVLADHHVKHPGGDDDKGVTQSDVRKAVGGKNETTDAALALAVERGQAVLKRQGRANRYWIKPAAMDPLHMGDEGTGGDTESGGQPVAGPPE